jgi:signal peptidase II
MCYDYFFKYDPCVSFNHLKGSGILTDCGIFGEIETRKTGFLFGNVVDMFQFNAIWPKWVPYFGGNEVFPAIWNIADFSISFGVILILIRQKKYFPKKKQCSEFAEGNNAENENLDKIEKVV